MNQQYDKRIMSVEDGGSIGVNRSIKPRSEIPANHESMLGLDQGGNVVLRLVTKGKAYDIDFGPGPSSLDRDKSSAE